MKEQRDELMLQVEELEERIAPSAHGRLGYEGQPENLLHALTNIEKILGRPADHARNISRNIDLDLLYCGEAVIATTELQLPHPRIFGREFVLRPLADIRPDLVLPGQDKSVAQLLGALPVSPAVVRLDREW